jgi:DNA helicase-2/ATP-dependent DNA helicase PcrA
LRRAASRLKEIPFAVTIPTTHSSTDFSKVPGLEGDAEASRIVAEELKLLATVQGALAAASRGAGREAAALRGRDQDEARLLELREDVAVAKPEDLPALFEQMHHLGALRAQRGKGAAGNIDRASPYFGHLRLEETVVTGRANAPPAPGRKPGGPRETRRRDVLVGARSYVDPEAGIRIVDWRQAPVSRIYYRYVEGDDYEEMLGDVPVEGVVVARRSVAIVAGELVRVAAPQGTFVRGKDGQWRRMETRASRLVTERRLAKEQGQPAPAPSPDAARLGVGADGQMRMDKHLPAIASLLDSAQFELIARPNSGLVAIQGSAGSGKTTVGLHRVAYLAFADPSRFRPERMMVVVPNDALVHYVARVLPSLGVDGVLVSTFARFARKLVETTFPKLPTKVSDDTPPVVSRAKSHPAMVRAIDAAVARVAQRIDTRIREVMAKWPDGDRVVRAWEQTEASARGGVRGEGNPLAAPPDARVTALAQWLAGKRTLDSVEPASALPDVTRSALERLGHELRSESRSVSGIWDELLTSRPLLGETFAGEPGFGPGQLAQVHEWCVRQARVRAEGERDGEVPTLDAEDAALLLRIWQVLRGPLVDADAKPLRVAHLFVDEVQDASPVELRVLIDLAGKDRSVTLAGDIAQRMLDEDDAPVEFDWHRLLEDLDLPHTTLEPLKVSYRSTAEITAFARSVLGPLAHEAEPIATRHGPPVELFTFASPGEAVAFLADALKQLTREEPEANVALVARFGPQADVYYEGLVRAEVPNVRRVSKQDFTWEPGVDVTDVRQTKGLEFDEVVLLETSAPTYPTTNQARHALSVAATRAAHQLWCTTSEKASPLVEVAVGATG